MCSNGAQRCEIFVISLLTDFDAQSVSKRNSQENTSWGCVRRALCGVYELSLENHLQTS